MKSDKHYDVPRNINHPGRNQRRTAGTRTAPDLDALASRLGEFRLDQDLTYRHLESLTGVSKSTLQRFVDGFRKLEARTIRKLERFLEAGRAIAS